MPARCDADSCTPTPRSGTANLAAPSPLVSAVRPHPVTDDHQLFSEKAQASERANREGDPQQHSAAVPGAARDDLSARGHQAALRQMRLLVRALASSRAGLLAGLDVPRSIGGGVADGGAAPLIAP